MSGAQDDVCGICRRQPTTGISVHVDHDHDTGRIRGLLCFRCNNALGDFEESAELLTRAAEYVFHHRVRARVAALVRQPA